MPEVLNVECPMCGGRLIRRKAPFDFGDVEFGEYAADVCRRCGEPFFTAEASRAIDERARSLGMFGAGRQSRVSTSGRGLVVRIPRDLASKLGLKSGQAVILRPEGKRRFVVEPS